MATDVAYFGPAAAVLAIAVLVRAGSDLCADVSWLLTVGEKVLAGATPYVDVIEVNPPASFLLYLPAIVIGRALRVAPEATVAGLVFLGVFASIGLTARILSESRLRDRGFEPAILAIVLFVLLIMPAHVFAQREHIAAIAILPILAACAARAERAKIDLASALLAGLAAGVAVVIKPHFGLALLLPLAYMMVRAGGKRPALVAAVRAPELMTAAGIIAIYAIAVWLFFPTFLADTLPIVTAVYVPAKLSLPELLTNRSVLLFFIAIIPLRLIAPKVHQDPISAVLALAASGFLLAMLIQAKGWPYHGYPAVGLATLALARLLPGSLAAKPGGGPAALVLRGGAVAAALMLAGSATAWFASNNEIAAIRDAVARLAPPNPKLIAITGDLSLGHPLTRRVNGEWVGRMCSQWITADAGRLLNDDALDLTARRRIEAYARFSLRVLVDDIARKRPDVVLVRNIEWQAWAERFPEIAGALNNYRVAETIDGVSLMLRSRVGKE